MDGMAQFMASNPIDAQLSNQREAQISSRRRTVEKNRAAVGHIMEICSLIARLGMPFRGHDESAESDNRGLFRELVEHQARSGDIVLKDHLEGAAGNCNYLSHQIQNEMIEVIGSAIHAEIVRRIKAATIFSVMMDETTDISNKEQVAIAVRYVYEGKIEERFYDCTATTDTTGAALTDHLIGSLNADSITLQEAVSQSYDGASNMSGAYRGVQARIKEKFPHVKYVYCYAHNLNRLLVNVCNGVQVARDFFGLVEQMYATIEGSAQRHEAFMACQRKNRPDSTPRKLAGLSDTRWNCRAVSLSVLLEPGILLSVMETLGDIAASASDGRARAAALGLSKCIDFKFILPLVVFGDIFHRMDVVSTALQGRDLDLMRALEMIDSLIDVMSEKRTDRMWEAYVSRAEALANEVGVDPELPPQRRRRVSVRVDDNPGNEEFLTPLQSLKTAFFFTTLDRICHDLRERFPREVFENFSALTPRVMIDSPQLAKSRLSSLATEYEVLGVQPQETEAEFDVFIQDVGLHFPSFSDGKATPNEIYSWLLKHGTAYPNLQRLYKLLLTMPVTSATAERSFSKLALIKTKCRNTMAGTRLRSLMDAACERDIAKELDSEMLVDRFAMYVERRMDLML